MKIIKKIGVILILGFILSCGVCGASPDSNMLAMEQKSAEIVVAGLMGASPSPAAAQNVARVFNGEGSKAFTPQVYQKLRANCFARFGKMLNNRFTAFQRLENVDQVIYLAESEQEKVVIMIFNFDKNGKLMNFSFDPPEQPKDKKKKKK